MRDKNTIYSTHYDSQHDTNIDINSKQKTEKVIYLITCNKCLKQCVR